MIGVQEQIDLLLKSNTMSTCLGEDRRVIPVGMIFTTPKISMNENIIDINNQVWTHIPDSYFYKNVSGKACPIFYINRIK